MNDPWCLQHDRLGTIHRFKDGHDGETRCGNGNSGGRFTRKRLSQAAAHPRAHDCGTTKKCGR